MWIMSTVGFFTAVAHANKPNTLLIRGRVKQDMKNLRKYMPGMGKITFHKDFDYPYRAEISHENFGKGMAKIIAEIDYPRFKPAVAKTQGNERARIYTSIWNRLIDIEADPNRINNYFSRQNSLMLEALDAEGLLIHDDEWVAELVQK